MKSNRFEQQIEQCADQLLAGARDSFVKSLKGFAANGMLNEQNIIGLLEGLLEDQELPTKVKGLIVDILSERVAIRKVCLKAISGHEQIMLPETSGKKEIKSIFGKQYSEPQALSPDKFEKLSLGEPMPQMPIVVFEATDHAPLDQAFRSISDDFSRLCLTQHQIVEFFNHHSSWLGVGDSDTYFLLKDDDEFVVISIGGSRSWYGRQFSLYRLPTEPRFAIQRWRKDRVIIPLHALVKK